MSNHIVTYRVRVLLEWKFKDFINDQLLKSRIQVMSIEESNFCKNFQEFKIEVHSLDTGMDLPIQIQNLINKKFDQEIQFGAIVFIGSQSLNN